VFLEDWIPQILTGKSTVGGPMQELSFGNPSHLDQYGTHLGVCDQFFVYSTVNIFINPNYERIECKIISLTKFSIPLSHHIYMTSYLFSLLTVTTHALHLMSLWSNRRHHSKSLIDHSNTLRLIFGTNFLRHYGNFEPKFLYTFTFSIG